jgi:hypothetical protein
MYLISRINKPTIVENILNIFHDLNNFGTIFAERERERERGAGVYNNIKCNPGAFFDGHNPNSFEFLVSGFKRCTEHFDRLNVPPVEVFLVFSLKLQASAVAVRQFVRNVKRFTSAHKRFTKKHQRFTSNVKRLTNLPQRLTHAHQPFTKLHQRFTSNVKRFTKLPQRFTHAHQRLTNLHQRFTTAHQRFTFQQNNAIF